MLAPIFDEAADKVAAEFTTPGKVVLGKVDCDKDSKSSYNSFKSISKLKIFKNFLTASIGTRFHISKYPTLKAVRNGQLFKKEYRGQRSAEAFAQFVREQLIDPVKEFATLPDMHKAIEEKKRSMIGYFETRESEEYKNFAKVAAVLKDDCNFHAGFGEPVHQMHPPGILLLKS